MKGNDGRSARTTGTYCFQGVMSASRPHLVGEFAHTGEPGHAAWPHTLRLKEMQRRLRGAKVAEGSYFENNMNGRQRKISR